MIDAHSRSPRRGGVARLAAICRHDVRRALARSSCAVVTADAIGGHSGMAEGRWGPCDRGVTRAAVGCRNDVVRGLACGRSAVVAGGAATGNLGVIHSRCRLPGCDDVARFAAIRRRHMRGVLPGRTHAVVATDAVRRDTCVIEPSRCPRRSRMAVVALRGRQDVIRRLAGCGRTVVAGGAATLHLRVIDPDGRLPCRRGVAGFARCA